MIHRESRAFPSTQIAMDSLANRHKITVSLLAKYRHFGQRLLCLANAGIDLLIPSILLRITTKI